LKFVESSALVRVKSTMALRASRSTVTLTWITAPLSISHSNSPPGSVAIT
jgi:hypothetical protein